MFGAILAVTAACNLHDDALEIPDQVEAINPDDLPSSSQAYVESNFNGEVITEAYMVTTSNKEVTYEAFLSNNANLVFEDNSALFGFGDIHSRVNLNTDDMGDQQNARMGNGNSGGMGHGGGMGEGSHNGMGLRGHPDVMPTEVLLEDLPVAITDYISENYAGNEILKAFSIEWEDRIEYHVLVAEVGALRFDADGNFIDRIMRGVRMFEHMEEVAIADLPAAVTDYIGSTYPDNEIAHARLVTLADESVQYQVAVMEVGVLVFDADGVFIEVLTHGMGNHNNQG